jgi:hypothetical protein
MANYQTAMELRTQFTEYEREVDKLRKVWRDLDHRNMAIKETFSQGRIFNKLENFQQTEKYLTLPRKKQMKICHRRDNLSKRMDERFEKEYPDLLIEYYRAYAEFLEAKIQLNGLQAAEKAYYIAVVNK